MIAFEKDVARFWEQGKIRAPVHLSGGNEEELIRIFQEVKPDHWVFSTHRSHYHALLKGIPGEWLMAEILKGHSITINNREHHFFSSAIVGGILPIALGVAMTGQQAWCFVGDMASHTGIFHECVEYAQGHKLPVNFFIEDNRLCVCTPTQETWGHIITPYPILWHAYKPIWPHQGTGVHVAF